MKKFPLLCALVSLGISSYGFAEEQRVMQRQAEAREVIWPSAPSRKEFRFQGGEAWLDSRGSMSVDVEVSHQSLRCAQYETSVRYGRGNPACVDVQWITPLHPLTKRQQCNNVTLIHSGTATVAGLEDSYPQVSCLQVQVHCKGNAC